MFDFFNEFFESELAKNNIIVIIIAIVLLLVIGAMFMWLYMSKIYMKCINNENVDLKKKVENLNDIIITLKKELNEVTENRDNLLMQNNKLLFYDKMAKAKGAAENDETDSALEQFIGK